MFNPFFLLIHFNCKGVKMRAIKRLEKQLRAANKTLVQLDKETPDDEGNHGQYSDLKQEIENFLVDELNINP